MKKLLLATTNRGKVREFAKFLKDIPLHLVTLSDVHITSEVKEDGKNYRENSQKKALEYSQLAGLPAIADDGGFEIQALDGAPGLKSHRWLGPQTTEEEIYKYMKKISKDAPDDKRNVRFVTVVSYARPDGKVWSFEEKAEGLMLAEPSPKYEKGYPYRSFFYFPELKKFYFEEDLTAEEREKYHHRYRAVQKLKQLLLKEFKT